MLGLLLERGSCVVAVLVHDLAFVDAHEPVETKDEYEAEDEDDVVGVGSETIVDPLSGRIAELESPKEGGEQGCWEC